MENLFIFKIILLIALFIVNSLLSEFIHRNLTKSIERAFYNSEIDHIMFQHKMKSIFIFCTILFCMLLLLSYFFIYTI
jgi:hypothetical protein